MNSASHAAWLKVSTAAAELAAAKQADPNGATCGFCGKPNDLADDCGFYYLAKLPEYPEKLLPACAACYGGEPGRRHTAKYGVGER